ncbi:MAG TPA: type II secretion system protein [bacterium]|nr:type II secretion system protein [bacterium]
MKQLQNRKGFTLIELLVVIAIIGILSTIAVVALGNARAKSRDAKRIADVKQITSALELYYNDQNDYPIAITPGMSLVSNSTTYMAVVPSNPLPRTDGPCTPVGENYTYTRDSATSYTIKYCLGSNTGDIISGTNRATPAGLK